MIKKFFELVRFSHTIFAMPFALASMFLAAGGGPGWRVFLLILLCVIFCRNTAMAFNRLVDRKLDKENPRTEKRHLPTGDLSVVQVTIFILINGGLFILATFFINPLTFWLSIPTLLIVCSYSLMKRFTALCHIFLGLAIGISPVGAWIAVRGEFHILPILLGLCLMLWIAGFDIIYATQDYEVDKKLGLSSMVTAVGIPKALNFAKLLHLILLVLLFFMEWKWHLGIPYLISVVLVTGLLLYIHFLKRSPSLEKMNNDFFLANAAISLILFSGIVFSTFLNNLYF